MEAIKTEAWEEGPEELIDSLSDLKERTQEAFETYADTIADLQDEIDELQGRVRKYQLRALMACGPGCRQDSQEPGRRKKPAAGKAAD